MGTALYFVTGLPLGEGRCLVIAQPKSPEGHILPLSILFELPIKEDMEPITLNWIATHLESDQQATPSIFVTGPEGCVGRLYERQYLEEAIDPGDDGPELHGAIRDLRCICHRMYAVGMGRQVYQRVAKEQWIHVDSGILASPASLEVTGFNAIDGLSVDLVYAVGFQGEIWRFLKNSWEMIESPTNLALYCLKIVEPGLIYVAGQKGIIIRGTNDVWEVLEHDVTSQDFWDIAWFGGHLYLATESALFRMNSNDQIEKIDIGAGEPFTCKQLKSDSNALWSFGESHIFRTADGVSWKKVFSY